MRSALHKMIRPAAQRSRSADLGRTLLQVIMFWSFFLGLVPWGIQRMESYWELPSFRPMPRVGWSLLVTASLLGLWSGFTMAWFGRGTPLPMDCANRLVVRGPYRFLRNPMAVAGLAQGSAVALILGSWGCLLYCAAGMLTWNTFVRPVEEKDLAERFGESFSRYRSAVRCWIPRLSAYEEPGSG